MRRKVKAREQDEIIHFTALGRENMQWPRCMRSFSWLARLAMVVASCAGVPHAVSAPPSDAPKAGAVSATTAASSGTTRDGRLRELRLGNKPWFGDFDRLLERRMIRVLVPYSRSLYYMDRGRERGLTAELVRDFEQYVNRKYREGKRPVTVYLIPTPRDRLLSDLEEGLGDIAAGNLTATDERSKIVDFVLQHILESEQCLAPLTGQFRKAHQRFQRLLGIHADVLGRADRFRQQLLVSHCRRQDHRSRDRRHHLGLDGELLDPLLHRDMEA